MKKNLQKFDLSVKGKKRKQEYNFLLDLLSVAEEIYNARMALKLSQQELAKKIGTTQKVISKIENADVNFGMDLILRISRVLKMQVKIGGFTTLPELNGNETVSYNLVFHNLEDIKQEEINYNNESPCYSTISNLQAPAYTNN